MATVYIAPTAQGLADGTSAANAYAYSSLSNAETDAQSGGTIFFTDGTYNVSSNIAWDADGVTYKSLNSLGAKISGGGANKELQVSSASNAIGSVVSGFYFEDFRFEILAPSDATVVYANQPKLQNSKSVHTVDTASQLIVSTLGVTDLAAVEFCEFYVRYTGARPFNYTQGMTMTNCSLFFDMTNTTGFTERSDAIFTFENCIFSTNDNSKVSQNYSNSSTNCCFHNMGTTNETGGTGNLIADPLFVDPDSADLRLRPGSPYIDDSEPSLQDLYPNALWVSGGYTGGSSDGSYDDPYTSIQGALASNSDADVVVCVKTGATPLTSGYTSYPVKSTVEIIGENGATLTTELIFNFGDMMAVSNCTYTFRNIDFLQNLQTGLARGVLGTVNNNFDLVLENCTYKVLDDCGQFAAFRANNMTLKNCFIETYAFNGAVTHVDGNLHVLIHSKHFTAENCTFYNKKNNWVGTKNDQLTMLYNTSMSPTRTASYTNCIFYAEGSTNTTTGLTNNNFTYRTFTDCCVYSPHNYLNDFTADKDSGTPVLDDPLFVDRANGDFRLRPGSPCITV